MVVWGLGTLASNLYGPMNGVPPYFNHRSCPTLSAHDLEFCFQSQCLVCDAFQTALVHRSLGFHIHSSALHSNIRLNRPCSNNSLIDLSLFFSSECLVYYTVCFVLFVFYCWPLSVLIIQRVRLSCYLYFKIGSVCLRVPRFSASINPLYPATDCAAATDISGVSGRWQLSR